MKEITVGKNEAGQRLDKLLGKVLNQAPASFIYKMLRKKNIKLNQARAEGKEILVPGDRIQIYLSDVTYAKFHEEKNKTYALKYGDVGLDDASEKGTILSGAGTQRGRDSLTVLQKKNIIYEDSDIIILNKPAGILSQKAKPEDDSINEQMIRYLLFSGAITEKQMETFTPSVCNRLDRNTSGIVLAGKSLPGSQELSRMLKDRSLNKYYLALVHGTVREEVMVCAYLMKDPRSNRVTVYEPESLEKQEGNEQTVREQEDRKYNDRERNDSLIETSYRPLYHTGEYTLLEVKLITGKTHQIRAHLAYLGYPIVGDAKYGIPKINQEFRTRYQLQNQCLHAWRVAFPQAGQGDSLAVMGKTFRAPLPYKVNAVYQDLFQVNLNAENRT